jgi:methenyltetrahydrofolate cyclohydrolase
VTPLAPPPCDSNASDPGRDRLAGRTSEGSSGAPAVESVQEFLAALASGAPTPGGGAAAALCGAMAAALVAMVGRVTAARDSSVTGEMSAIVALADDLGGRLAGLMTDDMDAYRSVIEARRSGGGPEAIERALARATEVPMKLAAASRDVLALSETLAPLARRSALSDLAVAAALAWGALESGAATARANLAEVVDAELARSSETELTGLLANGQHTRHRLLETIRARAGR